MCGQKAAAGVENPLANGGVVCDRLRTCNGNNGIFAF